MADQKSKNIKCLLFDIDKVLITEIIYVTPEPDDIGGANCKLIKPYLFLGDNRMEPWPSGTEQNEVMISSDKILTIAEPAPNVIEKYLELTS